MEKHDNIPQAIEMFFEQMLANGFKGNSGILNNEVRHSVHNLQIQYLESICNGTTGSCMITCLKKTDLDGISYYKQVLFRIRNRVCANCLRFQATGEERFYKCSNCRQVYYCSKDCQIRHWKKNHKTRCCELASQKIILEGIGMCDYYFPSSHRSIEIG